MTRPDTRAPRHPAPRYARATDAAADARAPRERGRTASIIIASISSGFGVILLGVTSFLGQWLGRDPYLADSGTFTLVVGVISWLFIGVAMYVAAIVTANTFATIVAGRTRQIALMRLIGASARSERSRVASEGLVVGLIGGAIGLVGGALAVLTLGAWVAPLLGLPDDIIALDAGMVAPPVVVALTTAVAAWVGSRRVLEVTPLQALGGAAPRTHGQVTVRRGRHITAAILSALGIAMLVVGVLAGLITPEGVVIAFLGGLCSFSGLVLAAPLIIPPLLRLTGRMLGRSATARIAAENALRDPERSSRMAIGIVIGVTLVMMFAVATESAKQLLITSSDGLDPDAAVLMDGFGAVMMVLVGVAAVIAAVGLVNLLTLGIVQRRREVGLLRALGLTTGQVRRVVFLEAVHLTVTALVFGLVLGTAYGWVGAQSLLGAVPMPPAYSSPTLVLPGIPWITVAILIAATAVLTAIASVVPTRLATSVAPVQALVD